MKHPPIIQQLNSFSSEIATYQYLQRRRIQRELLNPEDLKLMTHLRFEALKGVGKFKPLITEITEMEEVTIIPKDGRPPYTMNVWLTGLKSNYDKRADDSINKCLDLITVAIGKLEKDIREGKRDPETGEIIKSNQQREAEIDLSNSIAIFDAMQFHPRVVEASKSCFTAGNYREAILNAFITLIDYVKERTGLDLDGDDLMNQVFSFNYDKEQRRITKYPIIRINELRNKSDRDEQQGFMFLCKGAAGGIRNPKAHKLIPQSNPLHTLEYLAFASLLMRRVEEGELTA